MFPSFYTGSRQNSSNSGVRGEVFLPLVEETVLDPSYRQRSIVAQGEAEAKTFCPQSRYVHELGRLIIVKCQFSMIDL